MKDIKIEEGWKGALQDEFQKPYFNILTEKVREEYKNPNYNIYPPGGKIFAAFDECPYEDVKVVIIGQDPYHGKGQANGLCFSVPSGIKIPPSLVNIFKEINEDTGAPIPQDGDLSRWAKQGVLLLNSSLTVREGMAASHSEIGWKDFTDAVVEKLNREKDNLVFILWGSHAIKKGEKIDRKKHLVLTSPHPSPLSAHKGFFGNHHFSKTNDYLIEHGKTPINW
ncbi:MAG: uracil-DNA glycosylase [Muribaculaceae bacterium]|nr:uracil-DNA glycosylase [Muribaculaceae bacterium]